jgi:hypothetical protein
VAAHCANRVFPFATMAARAICQRARGATSSAARDEAALGLWPYVRRGGGVVPVAKQSDGSDDANNNNNNNNDLVVDDDRKSTLFEEIDVDWSYPDCTDAAASVASFLETLIGKIIL